MIFAYLHENKGPFIYYVITFLGFLDPPPYVLQALNYETGSFKYIAMYLNDGYA